MDQIFYVGFTVLIMLVAVSEGQMIMKSNSTVENCPGSCHCVEERVYCDQLFLSEPPSSYPEGTEYLTLKHNKIRKLGRKVFRDLTKVQYLLLSDNKLDWIYPGAFQNMRSLLTLSLMTNNIKRLSPKAFTGLENLQVLTLRHNKLMNIHRLFKPLFSIRLLNLANNHIRKIKNKTFRYNRFLQYLDLRNNSINYIQKEAFFGLFLLKAVVVRHNLLKQVDLHFYPGKYLDFLDFSFCKLKQVPNGLPYRLGDLRLEHNRITEISNDTFNCTKHMNLLDLNNNEILNVDEEAFTQFESLHDLHMKGNHLNKIPKVPKTIEGIFMNNNNIKNISEEDLSGLNKLAYLVLKNNDIEEIQPKMLKGVKKLKGLYLSNNKIMKISPMAFYNLNELEALDLSNNPVQVLAPFSFFGLENVRILRMSSVGPKHADTRVFSDFKHLEFLDFSRSPELVDQFAKKPKSLKYFKSVEDLNFMEDNLNSLPSNFPEHFPMLRVAKLSGNPWHCDGSLLWLANWIRRAHIEFLYQDHVTCASPPELKGLRLSKLYLKDIPTPEPTTENPFNININITFRKSENSTHITGNITAEEIYPEEKQPNRVEFVTFPNLKSENQTDVSNKINNFSSKVNLKNVNVTLWNKGKLRHKRQKWKKFAKRRRKSGFKIIRRGKGSNKNIFLKKNRKRNKENGKKNNVLGVSQNNEHNSNLDINSGEDSLVAYQGG